MALRLELNVSRIYSDFTVDLVALRWRKPAWNEIRRIEDGY